MRWRNSLWIGTSCLVLVTVVCAQGFRGPGPGSPRGFGFGGPGFSDSIRDVGIIGQKQVQEELKLSEEQRAKVVETLDDMREQTRAVFESANPEKLFSLDEKERNQHFAKMRSQTEDVALQVQQRLNAVLNKQQAARFSELQLQHAGVRSLLRDEISKSLKLSDEQREKLRETLEHSLPFSAPPEERKQIESNALAVLSRQQQDQWAKLKGKEFRFEQGFGPGGPGGFGPPMGGPGGPTNRERPLLKQFDKNDDGYLNQEERQAARESLKKESGRRGGFGPGGPAGFGGPPGGAGGRGPFGSPSEPGRPGPHVTPSDVAPLDAPLYDPAVLHTIFIDFESADWEAELSDFHGTDVDVAATLTVGGKKYPNVGIRFRGMSSYGMVPAGSKRSLNVSLDLVDSKQRIDGYKTLNLLNAHEDDSFMSTVLYSHIARQYIPAPKANFVKVVINGESWGVYVNVQQFNKDFLAENFPSTKGARWKVSGSPGGGGGLEYLGENVDDYKRRYEMKSGDDKSWKALIKLCKTLNESSSDQLEAALEPMLDIDGLLWFLALDNTLINCDGYWIRASDYSIYLDPKGKFHILPHDMNEAFRPAMGGPGFGPGGPGGGPPGRGGFGGFFEGGGPPGGRPGQDRANDAHADRPRSDSRRADDRRGDRDRRDGIRGTEAGPPRVPSVELDPLIGLDDSRKPLRSKVLAVPNLRTRYLQHVRTIAEQSLDWKQLGPIVSQFRSLIEKELEDDTRKLSSFAAFQKATADVAAKQAADVEPPHRFGPPRNSLSLRAFADQRRQFLLNHEAVRLAAGADASP